MRTVGMAQGGFDPVASTDLDRVEGGGVELGGFGCSELVGEAGAAGFRVARFVRFPGTL